MYCAYMFRHTGYGHSMSRIIICIRGQTHININITMILRLNRQTFLNWKLKREDRNSVYQSMQEKLAGPVFITLPPPIRLSSFKVNNTHTSNVVSRCTANAWIIPSFINTPSPAEENNLIFVDNNNSSCFFVPEVDDPMSVGIND